MDVFPDEAVSSAVSLLFRKFSELESAFKVARYFHDNVIRFPKYSCWRIGAYKSSVGKLNPLSNFIYS